MTLAAVGSRARRAPYVVFVAVAGAAAYVALVDPGRPGHYPTCPFLAVTGCYCPGCGTLRMVHALTHGHVARAFGFNPLTFILLPILGHLWVRWAVAARRGRSPRSRLLRPPAAVVLAVVIVVFWVLRDLPAGRALAP